MENRNFFANSYHHHHVDIGRVIHLKKQAISKDALPLAHCDYLSPSIGLASYLGLYLPKKEGPNYAEVFVEAEKRAMWKGYYKQC
ncbi:hypothetical protein [Nitrosomonas sp. Nm132]|jgi:hypothetical protein|uniref:hypothetical protein n=1 Tax=Nitrosomonas sp. Nm132 TaxID=1881053 RepID=UPI000B8387D7|nr:hypothetical protein [Nitrosomonas sp. Nm132]